MIIGITGTNGAGKGTVVEYLVNEKGFTYYSNSGFLAEELERRGVEKIRTNLRAIGNEFRKTFGSGHLAKRALRDAEEQGVDDVVIEAIRSSGEADAIKDAGGVVLLVDADRQVRYERIQARRSEKDRIDFDTFVEQEEREWYGTEGEHDMNMRAVMDAADHVIQNNGTLEELHAQIDEVLKKIEKGS